MENIFIFYFKYTKKYKNTKCHVMQCACQYKYSTYITSTYSGFLMETLKA